MLPDKKIDYILISKYQKKGNHQGYHKDKDARGRTTQVVDVSIGPKRFLEIDHPTTGYRTKICLEEKKIYIMTHFFNTHFRHKYVHQTNKTNYSLTYRNEK